jgi:hypothetical protein
MWGTFLSEPLPIADSVGRYPADYLMGRTAIPHHRFHSQRHAPPRDRPGLILLSEGCPGVRGRFDTRYAPVRRSPPGYCYPALPLDLHVLGL